MTRGKLCSPPLCTQRFSKCAEKRARFLIASHAGMLPLAPREGPGALGLKELLLGQCLQELVENSFKVSPPASFSQAFPSWQR